MKSDLYQSYGCHSIYRRKNKGPGETFLLFIYRAIQRKQLISKYYLSHDIHRTLKGQKQLNVLNKNEMSKTSKFSYNFYLFYLLMDMKQNETFQNYIHLFLNVRQDT